MRPDEILNFSHGEAYLKSRSLIKLNLKFLHDSEDFSFYV